MLLRPSLSDLAVIGVLCGRVVTALGLTMILPAAYAGALRRPADVAAFVLSGSLAVAFGETLRWRLPSRVTAQWHHGMLVAAMSWLLASFFGALPLYLSGHWGSFVDAYFEAMSGLATAGLSVANDLDHLSDAVNFWRQMLQFLGGQGLVVIVISLFSAGQGAVGMYVGEAREDKILPNVSRTAQFIWRVSLAFAAVGVPAIFVALVASGVPTTRALTHAPVLFFAAFDTGGFAPQSSSVAFYHSVGVEAVLSVLMVAGALSFAVHYQLWHRRETEVLRNTELRLLATTLFGIAGVAVVGLVRSDAYSETLSLFRRGFFQVLSAHTGTGFQTVPGPLLVTQWGVLAPAMLVVAMGLGAMAGSTAGGIKGIRVAIAAKTLQQEIRRVIRPPRSVTLETYHAGSRRILREEVMRGAGLVLLLYLVLYGAGALVGLFYGYPFEQAVFESVSASAAVGLSTGVTGPELETGLKVTYILQMWVGRLEFIAIFALFGYAWSALRGRA